MKRLFIILIGAMLTFTLSACWNNDLKSNTIVNTELTVREKAILSTTSNQSFVFDFNIDDEYKEIAVWLEKYEFGKLIEERMGYVTTEVIDNGYGSIIFTSIEPNDIDNQTFFKIGINSNRGTDSVTGATTISDVVSTKGVDGRLSVQGNIIGEIDITNEQMVLASIGFSWDEDSIVSFSPDLYSDDERRSIGLENYEVAYLLKSTFLKK